MKDIFRVKVGSLIKSGNIYQRMQQSKNPSKHKQLETWKLPVQILDLHNSYNVWKKGNYIVQFKPTVSPQPKVFSQSNRKSLPKVQTVNVRPPICPILFSPTYLQSTASPGPQRQSDLHWEPETSLLPPMFTSTLSTLSF